MNAFKLAAAVPFFATMTAKTEVVVSVSSADRILALEISAALGSDQQRAVLPVQSPVPIIAMDRAVAIAAGRIHALTQ